MTRWKAIALGATLLLWAPACDDGDGGQTGAGSVQGAGAPSSPGAGPTCDIVALPPPDIRPVDACREGDVVFGPERVERTQGPPTDESFTVAIAEDGPACISVLSDGENGSHRVASAKVRWDGAVLIEPDRFSQNVTTVEEPFEAQAGDHTLGVRVTSKPGTYLDVSVLVGGEVERHGLVAGTCLELFNLFNLPGAGGVALSGEGTALCLPGLPSGQHSYQVRWVFEIVRTTTCETVRVLTGTTSVDTPSSFDAQATWDGNDDAGQRAPGPLAVRLVGTLVKVSPGGESVIDTLATAYQEIILDTDGDGVDDFEDNCPNTPNPDQQNADGDAQGDACDPCPQDADNDADSDGVCGDVDNCPATANAGQENRDGDSLGDACDACPDDADNDADGDGVCGDVDNCPATANAGQENRDSDDLGDACDACPDDPLNDLDGDGVCGDVDNCPDDANPGQSDRDNDGPGDACDPCPDDADNDVDNDGVCGDVDNCPAVANTDQANADSDDAGDACDPCPFDADDDADSDGVCGDVDNCPATANAGQLNRDNDAFGDACDTCPDDPLNDADSDGVCGDVDNCPSAANPGQEDRDNDTLGDACDACPDDPNNDTDGDGVCGDVDNCPNTANADQSDRDGDGPGDACDACPDDADNDADDDGVCGDVDNCPALANAGQSDRDSDGSGDACDACPDDPLDDVDQDGVCGDVDNCPTVSNVSQLDIDSDGLGDGCDDCPLDADNDLDSDGVCGDVDNCPADANAAQVDADADGAGDACDDCPLDAANDLDADGVCGDLDNCPFDENATQSDVDQDGQGDACDVCPFDADDDADQDGVCGDVDNCPAVANASQADLDVDTLGDACDNCPDTANLDQADADGDGQGDVCETVLVPDVVGQSQAAAEAAVVSAGLAVGAITEGVSQTLDPGFVSAQNPAAGLEVRIGTPVSLAVVVNRPPVLEPIADLSLDPNGCLAVPVVTVDADGDALVFTVSGPTGLSIDGVGLVTWFPQPADVGEHLVTVTVSDGKSAPLTQTFTVTVVATADRLPPILRAMAPSRVAPASAFALSARATDNVAVASVRLELGGLVVATRTAVPYAFTFNGGPAPATLQLSLVATDAAGNTATELVTVAVDDAPDGEPPVLQSINAPAQAAPGETVRIGVVATDDFGVARVELDVEGVTEAQSSASPHLLEITVAGDKTPGEAVPLTVRALDAAGNDTTQTLSLLVAATPDGAPPTGVTVTAPATVVAGERARLTATAQDDQGILRTAFARNGALIVDDLEAPYDTDHRVSATLSTGDALRFEAFGEDFSGNTAEATPVCVAVLTPPQGALRVVVFDDRAGRPLSGALVSLASDPGVFDVTAANGRASLLLPAGEVTVDITAPGMTAAHRRATVLGDEVTRALDARLTALAEPEAVDNQAGGTAGSPEAVLHYSAGALGEIGAVTVTELSEQGAFAPLPLGWRPVFGLDLGPPGPTNAPIELEIDCAAIVGDFSTASQILGAAYDPAQDAWVRVPTSADDVAQTLTLTLDGLAPVALVKRDMQPIEPPQPAVGAPYIGVVAAPLPVDATAIVLPQPEVVFVGGGAGDAASLVNAELALSAPVPSGSLIRIGIEESYIQGGGTVLSPPGFTEALQVFQRQGSTQGTLTITALPDATGDLVEGTVHLTATRARDGPVDGAALLGPPGGVVTSSDGVFVAVPSGALLNPTTIEITRIDGSEDPFASDPDTVLVTAIDVAFEATFGASATLEVDIPGGVPPTAHVLLGKVVELGPVAGGTVYQLVGIGDVFGERVTFAPGALGLPVAAVDGPGRYLVVRIDAPVGFISGQVTDGGVPTGGAVVRSSTLPLVGVPSAAVPSYTVAGLVGEATISARSFTTGHAADATVQVPGDSAIVAQDLDLAASGPTVTGVRPPDGQAGVSLSTAVAIDFSAVMDTTTLEGGGVRLQSGGSAVSTSLTFSRGDRQAILRPDAELQQNQVFDVIVDATVADTFGQNLAGSQPDGSHRTTFSTLDITPPDAPEPGTVTASIPDAGTTTIQGGPGAVEGGATVGAVNETTGETTTVIAGADGSFTITANAGITDGFSLIIIDDVGNQTTVALGPFRNADGATVIGSAGGTVLGPAGSQLDVPPGAVPDGTIIRLDLKDIATFGAPVPPALQALGGYRVEMSATAGSGLTLSFPAPAGVTLPADSTILALRAFDFFGETRLSLVEVAEERDGRIVTTSPPFCGITATANLMIAFGTNLALATATASSGLAAVSFMSTTSPGLNLTSSLDPNGYGGGSCTEFCIPRDEPFTGELADASGQLLSTVDFGAPDWTDFGFIFFPGPEQSTDNLHVVASFPERDATDIGIATPVLLRFSEELKQTPGELMPVCTALTPHVHCLCVYQDREGDKHCIEGTASLEADATRLKSVVRFEPTRRLKYGAKYIIDVQGIESAPVQPEQGSPFTKAIDDSAENVALSTFQPRVVGSLALPGAPRDLAVLDDGQIAVAMGPDVEDESRGVMLVDVSDPTSPAFASAEAPSAGISFDVEAVRGTNRFISLTASFELRSRVHLFDNDGSELGRRSITASLFEEIEGLGPFFFAGWPFDAAVAPLKGGGHVAYIATIGRGVQAVTTDSIQDGVTADPAIFGLGGAVAVGVLGDTVLAGDFAQLHLLNADLTQRAAPLDIAAHAIETVQGLSQDTDRDGTIDPEAFGARREVFDLALVLSDEGSSEALYLLNFRGNATGEVLSRVPIPSVRARSVEFDPVSRMAYVATTDGVWAVDMANVRAGTALVDADADGRDDRLLGRLAGIDSANAVGLSSASTTHVYVGSINGARLRVVAMRQAPRDLDFVEIVGVDQLGRVFPGAPEPGGDFNDIVTLRVRLAESSEAGIPVFWDAIDVNDPSSDEAPVDPNGPLGNDNRGNSGFSIFSGPDGDDGQFVDAAGNAIEDGAGIAMSLTESGGFAQIRFRVTHQPGDNFQILASSERDALVSGDPATVTPPITVWRRLHFELDSMGQPPPGSNQQSVTIASGEPSLFNTLVRLSTPLAAPNDDPDQFDGGTLTVSGEVIPIITSTAEPGGVTVLLLQGERSAILASLPTTGVLRDDDFSSLTGGLVPVEYPPVQLPFDFAPVVQLDYTRLMLGQAFIEPVVAAHASGDIVPFEVNTDKTGADTATRGEDSSEAYWSTFVVAGFQPSADGDLDGERTDLDELGSVFNAFGRTTGAIIHLEVVREESAFRVFDFVEFLQQIVIHEVGHTFGIVHSDVPAGSLMNPGALEVQRRFFSDQGLAIIRSRKAPFSNF